MDPRFFFGAMSPYSWFAAERIDGLLARAQWRPLFLGGIFKENGRTSWGLTDGRSEGMADCEARAASYGLGPIHWPEHWPTNDLLIARGMVHAERQGRLKPFALSAMRLAFREGADLGDRQAVIEAGSRAGLDAPALDAALDDPDVKQALRAVNEEAVGAGVFGVPTVVLDGRLFWGDDRLAEAAAAVGTRQPA